MQPREVSSGQAPGPLDATFGINFMSNLPAATTAGVSGLQLQGGGAPQWVAPPALEAHPQTAWTQFPTYGQQPAAPDGSWLQPSASSGSGGYAGRLDPATMAAKLAAAREKNRLAQQRFRERQRERQKQAGEQCGVLAEQIEELEDENERLQRQNRIYERVLAVRDAMLDTFTSLHPPPDGQRTSAQELPMSAAAQGLAKAIQELPSEGEIHAAAPSQSPPQQAQNPRQRGAEPQQQGSVTQPAGAGAEATRSSGSAARGADAVQRVSWSMADPHRSGVAAQLDGSALRDSQNVPIVSDESIRAKVVAMTEPEHLLDYYRQWQTELSMSYVAAKAAGFDAASVAEVEAVQERMTLVWWHVGEMKPAYLCYLAHAALPENSAQFPLWREIAAEVLPQMDENQRAILRRCWHSYSMRLAKTAVGVSRWVKRLQDYSIRPPEGLVTNAQRSLELMEITKHMAAAVQEEYIANMEFVAEQAQATSAIQKAFMNHASAPFQPDVIAIDYHILLLDSQQRRAAAKPGGQAHLLPPPLGTAGMPALPSSPQPSAAPGT